MATYGHHLQDSASCASAKVDGHAAQLRVVKQLLDCSHMALSQVHHMNVVTHSCAVPCVVVTAIHIELGSDSCGYLLNIRHQVVGDADGVLSNQSCRQRRQLLLCVIQRLQNF